MSLLKVKERTKETHLVLHSITSGQQLQTAHYCNDCQERELHITGNYDNISLALQEGCKMAKMIITIVYQ